MNKVKLKRCINKNIFVLIIFITILTLSNLYFYRKYTINYNKKISSIVSILKDKYKDITDVEIANILNSNNHYDLSIYGIDISRDSIILYNNKILYISLISNIVLLIVFLAIEMIIFLRYNNEKDKEINEISINIKDITNGIYNVDIDKMSEDELSILRNDLYKVTLKLKEESEINKKDKINLKSDIESISHQLKTPLTSILISIDNILDNDMDEKTRRKFLINIKKEISDINSLVKSLLELSRFDVNVIKFSREKVLLKDIIDGSINKLSMISDLKNVSIVTNYDKKISLNCDKYWQCEALTNIIKNALEHSNIDSSIYIDCEENNSYIKIEVINDGIIDNDDLKNIFKRFYKGKNSNGVGIGLSLAKTIIEKDNGIISVSSNDSKCKFTIKYFKL